LQRLCGNQVVQRLVRSVPSSQIGRKSMDHVGLPSGVTRSGEDDLMGMPPTMNIKKGNLYVQNVADTQASKLAALQKAAEVNAVIGAVANAASLNEGWTKKEELRNKPASGAGRVGTLDPFLFEPRLNYTEGSSTTENALHVRYQFAQQWYGYVVRIDDSANTQTRARAKSEGGTELEKPAGMYASPSTTAATLTPGKSAVTKYSNIHDATTTGTALSSLLSATDASEKNLDAYTKIAGEGARWKCVRAHASHLRDSSRFFTQQGTNGKILAVEFRTLWLNWLSVFEKRFDIEDATVASAIATRQEGAWTKHGASSASIIELAPTDLGEQDYDLDNHRGWQATQ